MSLSGTTLDSRIRIVPSNVKECAMLNPIQCRQKFCDFHAYACRWVFESTFKPTFGIIKIVFCECCECPRTDASIFRFGVRQDWGDIPFIASTYNFQSITYHIH